MRYCGNIREPWRFTYSLQMNSFISLHGDEHFHFKQTLPWLEYLIILGEFHKQGMLFFQRCFLEYFRWSIIYCLCTATKYSTFTIFSTVFNIVFILPFYNQSESEWKVSSTMKPVEWTRDALKSGPSWEMAHAQRYIWLHQIRKSSWKTVVIQRVVSVDGGGALVHKFCSSVNPV